MMKLTFRLRTHEAYIGAISYSIYKAAVEDFYAELLRPLRFLKCS